VIVQLLKMLGQNVGVFEADNQQKSPRPLSITVFGAPDRHVVTSKPVEMIAGDGDPNS
jgi:hypothetical protein